MKKSEIISKKDLRGVIGQLEGRLVTRIEHGTKELIQHFNASQAQQTPHFEKLLAEQLADHHASLTESISEIIINDQIKPLYGRVRKLETRVSGA